jgi:hypothetical protein
VVTARVMQRDFFLRPLPLPVFLLTVALASGHFGVGETAAFAGAPPLSHAAFILNAARFTTWPAEVFADPASPLVLCIYKDRQTGKALHEHIQSETIQGRPLRQVDIDSFLQIPQCHLIYLPSEKMGEYPFAAGDFYGLLTISDCREFAESGGMLGFVRGDREVQVIVNPEVLTSFGLSIGPALLQVAEPVHTRKKSPENRESDR